MAIRYDKKLNQEINKTIRNFNQKITRLEKSERDLLLPEKITKKELKENVYTRTELRRKLRELQLYSKRNIEETITTKGGVTLSRYELTKIKRESSRIKASLTREINKMQSTSPKVFGKKQATTFAQMGDQYYLNLQARRKALEKGDIGTLSSEQLKQYKSLLEKTRRNKTYYSNIFKDNYMQMLTDMGYFYGYDKEKLDKLKETISSLDSDKFLKLFREEKSIQAILEYYPNIVMKSGGINPDDIKEDVKNLYDALVDNIDDVLKDYA
jgi:hypothetical protein